MPGDDLLRTRRIAVVGDDEAVRELAISGLDREVALVALHGVLENLARHGQKLLVERANGDRGPLDQIDDLGKRLLGHDRGHAEGGCCRLDALAQHLRALGVVRNDLAALESHRVVDRRGHLDGAGSEKAVSVGDATRGEAGELSRNDVGAVERQERADRPREPCIAASPAL